MSSKLLFTIRQALADTGSAELASFDGSGKKVGGYHVDTTLAIVTCSSP